jgi:hypothetical protein
MAGGTPLTSMSHRKRFKTVELGVLDWACRPGALVIMLGEAVWLPLALYVQFDSARSRSTSLLGNY